MPKNGLFFEKKKL